MSNDKKRKQAMIKKKMSNNKRKKQVTVKEEDKQW